MSDYFGRKRSTQCLNFFCLWSSSHSHIHTQYFILSVYCNEGYLKHFNFINLDIIYFLFSFSDALQETLGFDWLLLFLQAHLHNTTVVRATRILVTMLSLLPTLNRFKEGLCTGSWLDGTDIILNKATYVVAGKDKMLQSLLLKLLQSNFVFFTFQLSLLRFQRRLCCWKQRKVSG